MATTNKTTAPRVRASSASTSRAAAKTAGESADPKTARRRSPRRPRLTQDAKVLPKAASSGHPAATPAGPQGHSELASTAAENAFGQNVLNDFRPRDLLSSAGTLGRQAARHPLALLRAGAGLTRELSEILAGKSTLAPGAADKRFADPAWKESRLHSAWLQAYLALTDAMKGYATTAGLAEKEAERAGFLMSQISDAIAPTNFLLGNPAALKRAIDTGGRSLLKGAQNLLADIRKGRPVPSQVDERPFKVGENLAVTPGSVVLRTEMFELVQYAPQTEQVHQRPLLVVPSIVNKYYAVDIAPGRSFFEYIVRHGFTLFVIVWKNPGKEHDHWGMEDYCFSIDAAIDAVADITGVPDPNLFTICGAGPVVYSLAGYYAARKQRKINSVMLSISILDTNTLSQAQGVGAFMDPTIKKRLSRLPMKAQKGRISANEFTLLFALLRPNELIWNYWVNNYLMGNDPPAFDILYWNADGTGMTAAFNRDFGALVDGNKLATPGAMTLRDTPIADLAKLDFDSYVVGAQTDHICTWQAVYRSAQVLGKRAQFVLANSGHVQTLVCPPGNPKSMYYVNEAKPATADEWISGASKNAGTWWDHVIGWWGERSGPKVAAPKAPGNAKHRPLAKAPGTYILERAQ
jgi:polyhydroxyalkanoate synthase